MELELGYKLGANSYLTANVFDIVTKDAIIFYYDTDNEDAYKNEGMAGTRGVEFEYRVKQNKHVVKYTLEQFNQCFSFIELDG